MHTTDHTAAAVRDRLANLPARRADLARRMSENVLLSEVRRACQHLGLLVYHTHRSDLSEPGFPDLVIVGRSGLLYRELKRETGKVTPEQHAWLDALDAVGQDAGVWRPSDWLSGRVTEQLAAVRRTRAAVSAR